jgi:hypothetical protein
MDIQERYSFIAGLPDEDVVSIYGNCAKILHERGKLALCKKTLRRLTSSQTTLNFDTPSHNRGKVKRTSTHSVLIDFLREDWSYLFEGDYDEEAKYYVYYHSDPSKTNMRFRKDGESVVFNGRPFYVGKGTGDRYKNLNRSRSHLHIVNKIRTEHPNTEIFHIFRENLTELEALELEAKLITFFGCSIELERKRAHFTGIGGGILINTDPAKRPLDVDRMMKIKGGG